MVVTNPREYARRRRSAGHLFHIINKGPNTIVVRFDAGVVFSVESNLVVPI